MGNAESTGDQHHDQDDEFAEFDGIETLGYRVLGVQPNSPASSAGLVSFFDFLVGANGQMLLGSGEGLEEGEEYDDIDFPSMLQVSLKFSFQCDYGRFVLRPPSFLLISSPFFPCLQQQANKGQAIELRKFILLGLIFIFESLYRDI